MIQTDGFPAARLILTAAAVLLVGGCATKGDMRSVQLELHSLAARQDSLMAVLRHDMLSTQDTIRGQSLQLFDFRGEIFRQFREISDGLSRLEALAGENQRGITGVRDQMANQRRSPGGAPGIDPAAVDEVAAAAGGDAEGTYNSGVTAFNRGTLSTARTAFQQFLQQYPSHALAPDAEYYMADILVQENRLDDALDAFQKIPEIFPTAAKVPEALYRVAQLQIELKQTAAARVTLERIVNTYPGTGVAVLAAEKLREIR